MANLAQSSHHTTYFPDLNGFRFFCFLSVFFAHSFHTESLSLQKTFLYQAIERGLFGNGGLGVNAFFVLSGFLITYRFQEERLEKGFISIPKFWMRRVLRIWPLYIVCISIGFIGFPFFKETILGISVQSPDPFYYLVFLANFDILWNGIPDSSVLAVLWSVAIEEQFYFFWPLLLTIIPIRFHLWLIASLIIFSICFRLGKSEVQIAYHSLSCMGDMVIGGLGAMLLSRNSFKERVTRMPRYSLFLLYFSLAALFLFYDNFCEGSVVFTVIGRTIFAFIILLIILEQSYAELSFFKLRNYPYISQLGTVSYGLYALHMTGILITTTLRRLIRIEDNLMIILLVDTFISLGITIALAQLSFKYFERPFLNLKSKFA